MKKSKSLPQDHSRSSLSTHGCEAAYEFRMPVPERDGYVPTDTPFNRAINASWTLRSISERFDRNQLCAA